MMGHESYFQNNTQAGGKALEYMVSQKSGGRNFDIVTMKGLINPKLATLGLDAKMPVINPSVV